VLFALRRVSRQQALGALLAAVSLAPWFALHARASGNAAARVGDDEISRVEVERRAAALAPFQRGALGRSWPEQRRALLEDVLIAERLLETQASDARREWGAPADEALALELRAALAEETTGHAVADADVEAYYAAHREQFEEPERLLIWRILVDTAERARALIAHLGTPTIAEFRKQAREQSLDDATHMRGGSLGYVAADGQTHMPELRVAPALPLAAARVKDGELVPEPVPEGSRFAVVWRRGTQPARATPLASVTDQIRARLAEARFGTELAALLARLRQSALSAYHPEPVLDFEPRPAADPAGRSADQPAVTVRAVRARPEATDRGLR
jgi:peptidyl-prolyl cis-trans isomerase C